MRLLIVANSLPHSFCPANHSPSVTRQGSQRRRRQLSLIGISPVTSPTSSASDLSWTEMRLGGQLASVEEVDPEWQFGERPNHPALITMLGLPHDTEHLFIGWPGYCYPGGEDLQVPITPSTEQMESLSKAYRTQLNSMPVWIDNSTAQGHYEGVCTSMLWPMLHNLLFDKMTFIGTFESSGWQDHVRFNECLAEAVAQEYQAGDQILILDYHLMLLPAMIRRLKEDALIAFYLRSPFPPSFHPSRSLVVM